MNWATRPYKALMRDYLLSASTPWRHALFLPGWDEDAQTGCLCVERALQLGAINHAAKIIAVERQRNLADHIQTKLDSFGFESQPSLFVGELSNLAFKCGTQIDFAMLDLLGTLDGRLAAWVTQQLAPHLTPHATIGVTLTQHWRNNRFMDKNVVSLESKSFIAQYGNRLC